MSNWIVMKFKVGFLLVVSTLFFALSSCDKTKHRMEVVKDCTGVYLRDKNGLDFKVCNESILENTAAGTKIKVRYDKLNECFGIIEPVACELLHTYEGKIEITEIL